MNIKSNRIMEEQKKELNLVEILKDCPKGTKLWSPICGKCEFESINESAFPIRVTFTEGGILNFCDLTKEGMYFMNVESSECVIFPSKDNLDWSTFKAPKPKWNPDTLQPFDKVLIKDEDSEYWGGDFYLYTDKETGSDFIYSCVTSNYKICIPYNEDTKHLLGTNKEADEFYRL